MILAFVFVGFADASFTSFPALQSAIGDCADIDISADITFTAQIEITGTVAISSSTGATLSGGATGATPHPRVSMWTSLPELRQCSYQITSATIVDRIYVTGTHDAFQVYLLRKPYGL